MARKEKRILHPNHRKMLNLIANGMSRPSALKEVFPLRTKSMSEQTIKQTAMRICKKPECKEYLEKLIKTTEVKAIESASEKIANEEVAWSRKKSTDVLTKVMTTLLIDFDIQAQLKARDPLMMKALASRRNDTARTILMLNNELNRIYKVDTKGELEDAPKVVFEGSDKLEDMPIEDTVLEPLQAHSEPEPITLDNTNMLPEQVTMDEIKAQ